MMPGSSKIIPLPEINDEFLVQSTLQGNISAFEKIVLRYRKMLFLFFRSARLPNEDAEDLSQETLIKSYRYLKSFNSQFKFKTWILKIAKNCLIDYKNQCKKNYHQSLDAEGCPPFPSKNPGPYEKTEEKITLARFQKFLKELPENFSRVATLRYISGCSYEEIAEICQISLGTVMSRLYRIRKRLVPWQEKEKIR
ncbi:RNA polymerase sigma factor [Candidatus Riflebacteria bacterium]